MTRQQLCRIGCGFVISRILDTSYVNVTSCNQEITTWWGEKKNLRADFERSQRCVLTLFYLALIRRINSFLLASSLLFLCLCIYILSGYYSNLPLAESAFSLQNDHCSTATYCICCCSYSHSHHSTIIIIT